MVFGGLAPAESQVILALVWGSKVEISEGAFQVRKDRLTPRAQTRAHKTF
jgi:hypothetical protein